MTTQDYSENPHSPINNDSYPAIISNKQAERLWDRVADRYAAKPIADEDAYAHKIAATRDLLHSEAAVLELGCGTGSTALAHAPYVKHIMAIDVSSRMIEIARRKAAAAKVENVEFLQNDIDQLQLTDKYFDAVLVLNLLHLLPNWKDHISACYNTLQPGGVFVSSTLCLSDGFSLIRLPALVGRMIGILPPLSFFTQNDLQQTLIKAGFDIEYRYAPARKAAVFLVARRPW